MSSVTINADSILLIGIASRMIFTSTKSSMFCRLSESLTSVPRLPRRRLTMSFCGILTPATIVSLISMIRSPATNPALALGPLGITLKTTTVSVAALNVMPIPSNSPSSGSFTCCISCAGIYIEWGSNSLTNRGITNSAKESIEIESTNLCSTSIQVCIILLVVFNPPRLMSVRICDSTLLRPTN